MMWRGVVDDESNRMMRLALVSECLLVSAAAVFVVGLSAPAPAAAIVAVGFSESLCCLILSLIIQQSADSSKLLLLRDRILQSDIMFRYAVNGYFIVV